MYRRPIGSSLLAILVLAAAAFPVHARTSPSAVVEQFHATLLSVMKAADALGVRGRYDRLSGPVEHAFNLPLMIRVASGSHWKAASVAQRERLILAFTRLSVSTYAAQFDGYSGQTFETLGEKPGPQKTLLVKTRIVSPDSVSVGLTYVMKSFDDEWRIVDVLLANKISQLATRRSEYRRVLKRRRVDGLIATLNEKADKLVPR